MWRYGVGMDCADYAQRAFLVAHGGTRAGYGFKPAITNENLLGLDGAGKLARVAVTRAAPGDLLILGSTGPGDPGHCVIVYSHEVANDAARAALRQSCGDRVEGFLAPGHVLHVYEVDSSWGAGPSGASFGGVRRDTWLYDETRGVWGRVQPSTSEVGISNGPAGHPLVGVYRPR
jgi:hypothetical protein